MRTTILVSAFAALALGAPRPQDIEFDQVNAAPDPVEVTPPVDGVMSSVSIQSASAATAFAAAGVTDVASAQKRDMLEVADLLDKRTDCGAEPAGTGPRVSTPDDSDTSFLNYPSFKTVAANAASASAVPQGYSLAFSNLQASTQTTSWLGYKTLNSYDPVQCASYCDQLDGCMGFNLYYERDPSISPASGCPNPTSVTNIRCSRWGVPINADTALNVGSKRNDFHVVISGSNGYNKNAAPAKQTGFTSPVELGGAINAPNDPVTNTNTYMGYKFFSFAQVQTFAMGVSACTAACTSQTAYNARHPPAAPQKPNVCNQVVVYVLSDNNQPQGIYCAMYSEEWAPEYATNYGQYRGSDFWSVSQAYAYTNETYAAQYPKSICAIGGCPDGSYRGGNCGGYGQSVGGTC